MLHADLIIYRQTKWFFYLIYKIFNKIFEIDIFFILLIYSGNSNLGI
jgi:hypothetical protein